MGCRVVDTAAMDKNKKLIHDFYDLVWSGIELANDPATTVAFAEVAAYLCHALEMEDAAIHVIAKEREEINQTAAQKRRERDQYQSATYQESYLFSDPNATVEEVILSAFGVIQKSVEEAKLKSGDTDSDIPGSVVLGSDDGGESDRLSRAVTPTPGLANAEAKPKDDEYDPNNNNSADGIENNDIDVNLLRERITKRSETTKKEHIQHRSSITSLDPSKFTTNRHMSGMSNDVDDGKKDIEELEFLAKSMTLNHEKDNLLHFEEPLGVEGQRDNAIEKNHSVSGEVPVPLEQDRQDRSKPKEGETPLAHFYRVLDEVLADQRKKAASSVLERTGSSSFEADKDLDPRDLKQHVQDYRSEKRSSNSRTNSAVHPVIEKFIKENQTAVCGMVLGALCFGLIFCAFGCYGIYMFVFQPTTVLMPAGMSTPKESQAFVGSEIHVPLIIHDNDKSKHSNEYFIRVVREVVHVDENGEVLRTQEQQNDEL